MHSELFLLKRASFRAGKLSLVNKRDLSQCRLEIERVQSGDGVDGDDDLVPPQSGRARGMKDANVGYGPGDSQILDPLLAEEQILISVCWPSGFAREFRTHRELWSGRGRSR